MQRGGRAQLHAKHMASLSHGASERDIVYSGLEDTMSDAVKATLATAKKHQVSYRIAAFINAIQRVTMAYDACGLTNVP